MDEFFLQVLRCFGLVAVQAEAAPIRVSQESAPGLGDFNANVLGFVSPFTTGLTTSAFYQYGTPINASYNGQLNGGPNPRRSLTQLFLVDAADGLSLVILHDKPFDGSGGSAKTRFRLKGGDTATILVKDDGEKGSDVDTGTKFGATHTWGRRRTDGYAIGSLDGSWRMLGKFSAIPDGITRWRVTNGAGANIGLVLEAGRRVRLDAIPEPASLALIGIAGVVLMRRRRKPAA